MMIPKEIYPCILAGDKLWFEQQHWFTQDGKYISETEHQRILTERDAEIDDLKIDIEILKEQLENI